MWEERNIIITVPSPLKVSSSNTFVNAPSTWRRNCHTPICSSELPGILYGFLTKKTLRLRKNSCWCRTWTLDQCLSNAVALPHGLRVPSTRTEYGILHNGLAIFSPCCIGSGFESCMRTSLLFSEKSLQILYHYSLVLQMGWWQFSLSQPFLRLAGFHIADLPSTQIEKHTGKTNLSKWPLRVLV